MLLTGVLLSADGTFNMLSHVMLSQMYCCQWMGKDAIISGGSEQNIFRILDRGTLNVSVGICTKCDTNCNTW